MAKNLTTNVLILIYFYFFCYNIRIYILVACIYWIDKSTQRGYKCSPGVSQGLTHLDWEFQSFLAFYIILYLFIFFSPRLSYFYLGAYWAPPSNITRGGLIRQQVEICSVGVAARLDTFVILWECDSVRTIEYNWFYLCTKSFCFYYDKSF